MRLAQSSAVITSCLMLAGCGVLFGDSGYFRDRGNAYTEAESIKPLEIPEGVEAKQTTPLYPIGQVDTANFEGFEEKFEAPRPEPLSDSAFTDQVKLQKLGDQRWILVSARPAAVWPQIRAFLNYNGLPVSYTEASQGIIETGWLTFKDDPDTKHKYRFFIDQGVQVESTEVHVIHMGISGDLPISLDWPNQSKDKEREAIMVDELAASLANQVKGAKAASLLAQAIGTGDRVRLVEVDGEEPYLRLGLQQFRAWATLTHSLGEDGFTTWDTDEVLGLVYAGYKEPYKEGEEPGFWSKLLDFDDSLTSPPSTPYTLAEVLNHLPASALQDPLLANKGSQNLEVLEDVPGYLVIARVIENRVHVYVRDGYGAQLEHQQARKLLRTIRRNLI